MAARLAAFPAIHRLSSKSPEVVAKRELLEYVAKYKDTKDKVNPYALS